MIDLIKRIIGPGESPESEIKESETSHQGAPDVHLATCAIFIEMAQIDNEFDDVEREHILAVFQDEYDLSREDVLELKKASGEMLAESHDLWKFTNVINQNYSNEEKCRIVELLWELVYADGKMDEHENYFIHKLAGLLRLTHRDLIDAKLTILNRHGKATGG